VTDADTGASLSGVVISIVNTEGRTVTTARTDPNGSYRTLAGLPDGTYFARTNNALGYVNEVFGGGPCCESRTGASFTVTAGGTTPGIDFALARGGTIRGAVTDALTGAPVVGSRVLVFDAGARFVGAGTSDSRGVYLLDGGLPSGAYYAHTANSRLYVNQVYGGGPCLACSFSQQPPATILTGTPIVVSAGATTGGIDFALDTGAGFGGRVSESGTGRPLRGVPVQVYDSVGTPLMKAVAGNGGLYALPGGLPPGTYFARTLRAGGYASELYAEKACRGECDPTVGDPISVAPGAVTAGIDFTLRRARTERDFTADGHGYVLWRHLPTGDTMSWQLQGNAVAQSPLMPVADLGWTVVGVADVSGDDKADVLWRHAPTGNTAAWLMDGATVTSAVLLLRVADANWQVVGTGDLDGDGRDDVVWRHAGTGQNAAWFMNGATVVSAVLMPPLADTNWRIVGVADADADGKADVFWRNTSTGDTGLWLMDGANATLMTLLFRVADMGWQVAGTADVDADGRADVFWRHATTGESALWLMNGAVVRSAAFLPVMADPDWRVAQVVDSTGDGKADVFWRHALTGDNLLWQMDGGRVELELTLPSVPDPGWTVEP
jgi:hypothetical protein